MGLGSVILGVFSFLLMIAGVLLFWVPFLGTMLSFLSPVLSIAGVILGGVAMSRAKQGMGESEGLATAGLVLNIIAFIPAMTIAVICGSCNMLCTNLWLTPSTPSTSPMPWDRDAGPGSNPLEDLFDEPDAATGTPVPDPNAPPVPMQRQGDETPLPPPPLPPGPSGAPATSTTAPPPTVPPAGVTTDPPPDPAPEADEPPRRRRRTAP